MLPSALCQLPPVPSVGSVGRHLARLDLAEATVDECAALPGARTYDRTESRIRWLPGACSNNHLPALGAVPATDFTAHRRLPLMSRTFECSSRPGRLSALERGRSLGSLGSSAIPRSNLSFHVLLQLLRATPTARCPLQIPPSFGHR